MADSSGGLPEPLPPQPAPAERPSWDLYGRWVRRLWQPVYGASPTRSEFLRQGFHIGRLPLPLTERLIARLDASERYDWRMEDSVPGYEANRTPDPDLFARLNRSQRHIRLGPALECMSEVLADLNSQVAKRLGAPWRVANLRALETVPGAEPVGPYTWHGDAFPRDVIKVLIYLTEVGATQGGTELIDREGTLQSVKGPPGTWLLFSPGELLHRGVPAAGDQRRLIVEVTLAPSPWPDPRPLTLGTNATYPLEPWYLLGPARIAAERARRADESRARVQAWFERAPARARGWLRDRPKLRAQVVRAANRVRLVQSLNIGGGPSFCHVGWRNLEEVVSEANPESFQLTPECEFPFADASLALVYSSHCLEHLDLATVERVLSEARRVLAPGCPLILKIPDYDKALAEWRARRPEFFRDELWGFGPVTHTWKRRQNTVDLDHRAAMVFCGFWNEAYGQPFAHQVNDAPDAYHGPPAFSTDELRALVEDPSTTPARVAEVLRERVSQQEPCYTFNHQSAWGAEEFCQLLDCAGFRVETMEPDEVIAAGSEVPLIEDMRSISLYCLARPS